MLKIADYIAAKNPTEGQKDAGNYKKGHVKYEGMDITIENPAGSDRSGVSTNGKKWTSRMHHHYGYIKRTTGKDDDHVDVFIKPGSRSSKTVYIINQVNPGNGHFDEHKVMLGFDSASEAKKAYLKNYEKGWKGLGSMSPMSIEDFKKWVYRGKKMKPAMKKEAYLKEVYEEAYQDELTKISNAVMGYSMYGGGAGMSGFQEQMQRGGRPVPYGGGGLPM